MKKVFFRVLPLAAAVLFATSCSKDENRVNNEPVNVVNQEKTVTVTGTLSKKSDISKLSCENGVNLTFDGNETLVFSGDNGKIHGETTLSTDAGATVNFTVELSYPADASYDLNGKSVTATIGTEPTGVTGSYENINAAAKDVYEVSDPVTINVTGNDFSFSDNIVMNVNVAFVKNEKSEAINISVNDGAAVSLAGEKICIVPANVKVTADGKTKNTTVACQIYTIAASVPVTGITLNKTTTEITVGGKETLTATILPANATDKTYTWSSSDETIATVNENGEVTAVAAGTTTIKATANDGSEVFGSCEVTVKAAAPTLQSETITFSDIDDDDFNYTYSGTYFQATGYAMEGDGMGGYFAVNKFHPMVISARNGKTIVKVVFNYNWKANLNFLSFSSGTFNGDATVNNVNTTSLTVSTTSPAGTKFSGVTIYYAAQ